MTRTAEPTPRLLAAAPLLALGCAALTWVRTARDGDVLLSQTARSPLLVHASHGVALGLLLLGAVCVLAFRRADPGQLRTLLLAGLATHATLLLALPLFSNDLYSYLAYAEVAARGYDPTQVAPAAVGVSPELLRLTPWADTPSVYGPVSSLALAAAGLAARAVDAPLWGGLAAWKLLIGAADLTALWLLYGVARRKETPLSAQGFALVALNPLLAWEVCAEGHNDAFVILGGALFVWALERARERTALGGLAVGILAKVVLLPTLLLHLVARARRSPRAAVGSALFVALLAALAYAPFFHGLASLQLLGKPHYEVMTVNSIHTLLRDLLAGHISDGAQHTLYAVATQLAKLVPLAVLGLALWRVRTEADVVRGSLAVLLVAVATAAWHWPWYWTWALPFALVEREARWQRILLALTCGLAPLAGLNRLWPLYAVAQATVLVLVARWGLSPSEQPAPQVAVATRRAA